jgi:outer membrane protein assembly factor BamE (lipoprotein component of BamABCDE complex)
MNMRRIPGWSTVLLLALPLIVAGCVSIGAKFRSEAVEQIKPGQTTQQEVLNIFGNPVRTGISDDSSIEWTYAYYKAGAFSDFEGHDLIIKFDSNGKVKSFSYHTTNPKDKMVQPK